MSQLGYNGETEAFEFTFGFIPTGTYTAVFTCDAAVDMPDTDDSALVMFSNPQNVSLSAGENTSLMF